MDPAGPLFASVDVRARLNKEDAKFVDVIHTNGGETLIVLGIGQKSGHVDFYPNGGSVQTGCAYFSYSRQDKKDPEEMFIGEKTYI